MTEEKQTQLFNAPAVHTKIAPVDPKSVMKFYIILAPEQGDVTVEPYEMYQDGMEALYVLLDQRDAGQYEGEIFAFYGQPVEYTNSVGARRIGAPALGAFVLKNNEAFHDISRDLIDDRENEPKTG